MSSSMLLHDVIMTSFSLQCCLQCLLCKIMGSSDEDKILIKNLHCSKGYRGYGVKKLMSFLEKGWSKSGLSCSVVSARDKSIVRMNWNGGSSMSGAVLNSRFLTRLLTSGEEDIERVSMLKKDILSTACELTTLILSISVTLHSVWLVWLLHL